MIKPRHKITIGQLCLMEETGQIAQFKKWWNIAPSFLFVKQITELIQGFYDALNTNESKKTDNEIMLLNRAKYEATKYVELLTLQTIDLILTQALVNWTWLMQIKNRIRSRRLRKISMDKNEVLLKVAVDLCNVVTNGSYKCETKEDVIKFKEHVRFLKDKHEDYYRKKNGDKVKAVEKTYLYTLVQSYYNYLEMGQVNLKTTMVHFLEIRKLAVQKQEAEKKQIEDLKNR